MGKPTVLGKIEEPYVIGGHVRRHTKLISGPVSYTTGGDLLTSKELGDTWLMHVYPVISIDGTRIAFFIPAEADKHISVKMVILDIATGVQVANASNQSTKKFIVPVDGIG